MPDQSHHPWLFPAVWVFGLLVAVCGWIAWAPYEFSTQETWAHIAKCRESWGCLNHPSGPQWWTPSFMGGAPLTTGMGMVFSSWWLLGWISLFGAATGSKLSILACIPFAAASMFLFARRATGREDMAAIASAAYTLCPSLWFRALAVEHTLVVAALAFIPVVGWTILHLSQKPSWSSALAFGVACSFLALVYIKAALIIAPLLLVFGAWAVWKNKGLVSWMAPEVWITAGLSILALAIIPLLPSLREAGSAALFRFRELELSQILYSSRTAMHFFDRLGIFYPWFSGNFPVTTSAGAYYPGAVPLLGLSLLFVLRRRLLAGAGPQTTSVLRLSVTLALLAFWLSHGPNSVIMSTCMAWVGGVNHAPELCRALLWLSLGLQGLVIHALVPQDMPLRSPAAFVLTVVYLFIPGFRLLSWIPFYSDLRAPFDFYQVGGLVWTCLASGIACALLLERLPRPALRPAAVLIFSLVWAADFSGHLRIPQQKAYPESDLPLYTEVAGFLREDPRPGSVFVHAGDYLYLSLPAQTGRPLIRETFQNYLQQRGLAALLAAGDASPYRLQSLRLAGVAFIVVDRQYPLLKKEILEELHTRLPLVLENRRYLVFGIPEPLAPAYFAARTTPLSSGSLPDLVVALENSRNGFLAVETGPASAGRNAGRAEPSPDKPFEPLPADCLVRNAPGAFTVRTPGDPRLLVIPEAWHRDWKAEVDGRPVPVSKALGALIAIPGDEKPRTWTFQFVPPWWVLACTFYAPFSWMMLLAGGALLLHPAFRRHFNLFNPPTASALPLDRDALVRPLAIVPTYNEAESLPTLLRGLIPCPGLHVLVVDDGSADGTAQIVKAHPEFGNRLFLMERSSKLGLGSAYREGFRWAAGKGYDACVEIDADMSHDPRDVPRLLSILDEGRYDAVIGSRYLDGLRVVNWPGHRLLLSTCASQYVRFLLGLPLTDATSGFKALRLSALQMLENHQLRAEGYAFQIELHFALWKSGARIKEVPITFTERREGRSKMSLFIAFEAVFRVLELAIPRRKSS